jgi:hypothetical protein
MKAAQDARGGVLGSKMRPLTAKTGIPSYNAALLPAVDVAAPMLLLPRFIAEPSAEDDRRHGQKKKAAKVSSGLRDSGTHFATDDHRIAARACSGLTSTPNMSSGLRQARIILGHPVTPKNPSVGLVFVL